MPLFYSQLEADTSRPEVVIMATGPLFLRLGVPSGMEDLLEGLAREVLRHQPRDIYRFAATHFEGLLLQREAHTAALSPSSTRDQDGLNHNTDSSKIQLQQQQEPVTDDVTTKVDIPLDFTPHSPASDSGAASAASTPASSPVRPPREKNKPQAVRAKLTTTGDIHHSPIFQQAMQTAFTADSLSQSRASKTPEPMSPRSRTSTPVENSNSNKTTSHDTTDKRDENIIPTSQSASESKPTSPAQNDEALVDNEINSSKATSPENKSFAADEKKPEESRFITTPVNEVANIFPLVAKTISSTEESVQSPPPSSPTKDDENIESKSSEEKNQENENSEVESEVKPEESPVVNQEEIVTKTASTVSSPIPIPGAELVHEENIASPAVSPSKPEEDQDKPEANELEIVNASQSPPPENINETSVSAASKRISELGSEDFKPQTPEVVVQSPDQSTCDDVSAAVLVEDEADVPVQQMQVVEEAEEPDTEVIENMAAEPTEEIETKSDAPQDKNDEENLGEEVKSPELELEEKSKAEEISSTPVEGEPEVFPELELKDENVSDVALDIIEHVENENATEENSTAGHIGNVAKDKTPAEHVENLSAEENSAHKEEVETETSLKNISNEQEIMLPEESETNEEQLKSEERKLATPDVLQFEEPDTKVNASESEPSAPDIEVLPLDKLSEEQPTEDIQIESQEDVDAIQGKHIEEMQSENNQEIENLVDVAEEIMTPAPADNICEVNNPETGSPIQSQSEVLIQDEETGIVSEAEDKSSILDDKIANCVAMSPEITEDKREEGETTVDKAIDITINENALSDITDAIASPVIKDPEVAATEVSTEEIETRAPSVQDIKKSESENTSASPVAKIVEEESAVASPVEIDKIAENAVEKVVSTDLSLESKHNNESEDTKTAEESKEPEEIKDPEETKNLENAKVSEEEQNLEEAKDLEKAEDIEVTNATQEIQNSKVLKTPEESKDHDMVDEDGEKITSEEAKSTEETEGFVETKKAGTSGIEIGENINDQNMTINDDENLGLQETEALAKVGDTEVSTEKISENNEEQEAAEIVASTDVAGKETAAKSIDVSEAQDLIEKKSEEEITLDVAAGPSQDVKIIDEAKLTSPTPPPSPVQSLQEENTLDEVVRSLSEQTEHIDEASGEIEKVQSQSEDVVKKESEKAEDNLLYPVPSTSIDFTPATPQSQSPTNEEANKVNEAEKQEKQDDNAGDTAAAIESKTEDGLNNEADKAAESTENESLVKNIESVVVEFSVPEENINNEIITEQSFNEEIQNNDSIIETSQETGEILPVQSSTEQETVIQVTQEEPTPSDSQSSLLGNEGLGAVSSVVIRYSLSEVNENPDESNEEIIINTKEMQVGEEETDKTEDEIKEEQEIADTLIAAVRESEETATDTASCENNSISGVDEIQASISEPAEVASIQTGSSKDAASLEHDDIQKEAIIIEPIDLSALDESDKLEDSINISEVSRTDSAAEEKIEETLPTLDSTQFQIDDISIGTAVQELVESPSSGEQIAKEILLGENMTKSEEQELEAAATKIQASFRGYQTRKEIDVTEMAQEKLVPAVVAAVIEEAGREENATWRAIPAQVNDEVDEEQLLAQTDAALAAAHKRYMEENSSPSALEELVQSSTLIAATPLAFADSSPPPSAPPAPHVSQLRNTYSSSGECADVSASVTEPVSWNGGISRVLDEESGELITPDDDEGVWATLEREIGETQEQENAATKIQAGFRGHRARQALLHREDAVQIATSSASDVSNSPFSGVRHTGEFHDSLLLPLSGDVPNEQQARLVHDTAEEDAANTGAIATGIQEDVDVITEQQLIILDQNVTSDYDNMSENSESFLDRAATRIQATFRGFKTRNDIKQKSPVRSPSPADIDAATKIQAGFRGYKVRKEMKNSATSPKLARIQSAPEIRIEESEEERSATKIQAGVRGYLTRQRLKKERSPQPPSPEPSEAELEGAVVKLQAGFRGFKARQDVKLLREGKDAKN